MNVSGIDYEGLAHEEPKPTAFPSGSCSNDIFFGSSSCPLYKVDLFLVGRTPSKLSMIAFALANRRARLSWNGSPFCHVIPSPTGWKSSIFRPSVIPFGRGKGARVQEVAKPSASIFASGWARVVVYSKDADL